MDIRNLQRTGGSSYSVTVPKQWVTQHQLTDKEPIQMRIDTTGDLVLSPVKNEKPLARSYLDIRHSLDAWVVRELIGHYLSGVDEIVIVSDRITSDQRTVIRQTLQQLVGLEMIDATADQILLRSVFDAALFPPSQSLEKMFLMAHSMLSDAIESVEHQDSRLAQDILNRDEEVDTLNFVLTRQCNRLMSGRVSEGTSELSLMDMSYTAFIASQVERIADHAVKIARGVLQGETTSFSPRFHTQAQHLLEVLQLSETLVKTVDTVVAHRILDQCTQTEPEGEPVQNSSALLADSLDRVQRYLVNIAEATIDHGAQHSWRKQPSEQDLNV